MLRPTNRITISLGRKGSGKSYHAHETQWTATRLLLLDTLGEHEIPGGVRFRSLDDLGKALVHVKAGEPAARFRFVYTPEGDTSLEEAFWRMAELVRALPNVLFVVDELGLYVDSHSFDSPAFEEIVRLGRHYGQSFHGLTHRPTDLPKLLRQGADCMYLFQTHEPDDIDYFARRIGKPAAQALPTLPVWRPGLQPWAPGRQGAPIVFESGIIVPGRGTEAPVQKSDKKALDGEEGAVQNTDSTGGSPPAQTASPVEEAPATGEERES